MMDWKRYGIEFLAAFSLVFVIFATGHPLAIAVTLGLLVYFLQAHVNPAVTFAMFHANKVNMMDILPMVLSQIAGGIAGFYAYKLIMPMLMKRR